jgi:hypothetical protein
MNEITIADLKMIIYQCLINDQDLPILSEQNTRTFLYRIAQYKGDVDECYEEMLSIRRQQQSADDEMTEGEQTMCDVMNRKLEEMKQIREGKRKPKS